MVLVKYLPLENYKTSQKTKPFSVLEHITEPTFWGIQKAQTTPTSEILSNTAGTEFGLNPRRSKINFKFQK